MVCSPTYRGWRIDHRHVVAVLERWSEGRDQRYQRKGKRHFLRREHTKSTSESGLAFRHKCPSVKIQQYLQDLPSVFLASCYPTEKAQWVVFVVTHFVLPDLHIVITVIHSTALSQHWWIMWMINNFDVIMLKIPPPREKKNLHAIILFLQHANWLVT